MHGVWVIGRHKKTAGHDTMCSCESAVMIIVHLLCHALSIDWYTSNLRMVECNITLGNGKVERVQQEVILETRTNCLSMEDALIEFLQRRLWFPENGALTVSNLRQLWPNYVPLKTKEPISKSTNNLKFSNAVWQSHLPFFSSVSATMDLWALKCRMWAR